MKLKPRREGGAFPGKGEEVRERNLKASRAPAWALRLERDTVRNSSRLGPCSQVWRGEAAAPGKVEWWGWQRCSGGCIRDSGRGRARR